LDNNFQQLQVKFSGAEQQKADLTLEVQKLSDRIRDEQTERHALEVTCQGYRQHYTLLAEKFEKIRDAADERDALRLENETTTHKWEDAEELTRGLRLQIQQLQSELADTKAMAQNSKELLSNRYEQRIANLNLELQEKLISIQEMHQQTERQKETNKELSKRMEKNDTGSNTDKQALRNIERKLKEVQKRAEDQNAENLTAKLEIKRLEEKVQDEKSKGAQLSFEKHDLEAKVRNLEKDIRRLSQTPKKSPRAAVIQTVPSTDEPSGDHSDNPSDE